MQDRLVSTLKDAERSLFAGVLELAAVKCLDDERTIGIDFPHVTENGGGAWKTLPASWSAGYREDGSWTHGNWTCGFWVGLLTAAALQTGDERLLRLAQDRFRLVAPRSTDPNTHDIGFIFMGSALPLHQATGESEPAEVAVVAAQKLRSRLVMTPSGAYIASWGPLSDPRGRAASAIDTMTNLPLLYWAAGYTGDASFALAAEAHALKTRDAFFREDDSTYHAVEYDLDSGARRRGYTFQGHADESHWSRGQAWAMYGFAATAAATRKRDHLETAERAAAEFFRRLGDRVVAPYDFDDPAGDAVPDSAASAVAASAMIDIGLVHPDETEGRAALERGIALLAGLCRQAVAYDEARRGLLQHGCYSRPHNEGVDSAVMFGDFFFVEALCKLVHPGRFSPERGAMA